MDKGRPESSAKRRYIGLPPDSLRDFLEFSVHFPHLFRDALWLRLAICFVLLVAVSVIGILETNATYFGFEFAISRQSLHKGNPNCN